MPTYCYRTKTGKLVELSMSIAEHGQRERWDGTIKLDDGSEGRRDYQAEMVSGPSPSGWPMESDAMGVTTEQIKEAVEDARRRGVPTDFNPTTGAAVFRDRAHRRKYLRAYNYHDRDGGYGD